MMEDGLLEEVKTLHPNKSLNALQTVGYRELFQFIDNEISLDTAISEIKKNTRRFAKRQGTWFRKDNEIKWFENPINLDDVTDYVNALLADNLST